ncbi:hypothetical protein CYMTET_42480 [Cymbomonas tetramitiformis]|uniref:Uncharacterized protein n=1 Tax=Cymbomonas tetramitiformis TaxID=36881 RepID=A0AAE0C5D0_9CHLO|nr:hypothetical protein CYMTET_42480 [Cymbomonas tetramitiformis]
MLESQYIRQLDELRKRFKDLEQLLRSRDAEIEDLKKKLADVSASEKAERRRAFEYLERAEAAEAKLRDQVAAPSAGLDASSRIETENQDLKDLQEQLAAKEAQNKLCQEKCQQLTNQTNALKMSLSNESAAGAKLKEQLQTSDARARELMKSKDDELKAERAQTQAAQTRVTELERELDALKSSQSDTSAADALLTQLEQERGVRRRAEFDAATEKAKAEAAEAQAQVHAAEVEAGRERVADAEGRAQSAEGKLAAQHIEMEKLEADRSQAMVRVAQEVERAVECQIRLSEAETASRSAKDELEQSRAQRDHAREELKAESQRYYSERERAGQAEEHAKRAEALLEEHEAAAAAAIATIKEGMKVEAESHQREVQGLGASINELRVMIKVRVGSDELEKEMEELRKLALDAIAEAKLAWEEIRKLKAMLKQGHDKAMQLTLEVEEKELQLQRALLKLKEPCGHGKELAMLRHLVETLKANVEEERQLRIQIERSKDEGVEQLRKHIEMLERELRGGPYREAVRRTRSELDNTRNELTSQTGELRKAQADAAKFQKELATVQQKLKESLNASPAKESKELEHAEENASELRGQILVLKEMVRSLQVENRRHQQREKDLKKRIKQGAEAKMGAPRNRRGSTQPPSRASSPGGTEADD